MERGTKELIFRLRGILPLPLLAALIIWARTTPASFLWGLALVAVGVGVRLWAAGYIKLYRVSEVRARRLVTAGPYAYVRNPLYWGNFLAGLGFAIIANWWVGYLLFGGLYLFTYGVVIPLEEEYLVHTFGSEYEEYRSHVPRLRPQISAYPDAEGDFQIEVARQGEIITIAQYLLILGLFIVRMRLR